MEAEQTHACVLRVWTDAGDDRVFGRVMSSDERTDAVTTSAVAHGIESILELVRDWIESLPRES